MPEYFENLFSKNVRHLRVISIELHLRENHIIGIIKDQKINIPIFFHYSEIYKKNQKQNYHPNAPTRQNFLSEITFNINDRIKISGQETVHRLKKKTRNKLYLGNLYCNLRLFFV